MQRFNQLRQVAKILPKKRKAATLIAAENAYEDAAIAPEGYFLDRQTPTLKFYRKIDNSDDVLLGVRGTYGGKDVLADAALAVGLLSTSKRYKEDKHAVAQFLKDNPSARVTTGGHSLGGAIARQLARDFKDNFHGGEAYNSAISLDELLRPSKLDVKQTRYTTRFDPLRLLSNPFLRKKHKAQVVSEGGGINPLAAHSTSHFDAEGDGA